MIKSLYFIIIILMVILSNSASVFALEEFDITTLDNPAPGYLFMGPVSDSVIAIFDNSGRPAYQKAVNRSVGAFNALRILENGKFAFFATTIEKWYIVDENLDITDSVAATEPYSTNFHTLHVSPQGHYLLLATDTQTVNLVGKVPNGKPNAMLYNLVIQEFDAQKNLVFQWDCYQHIDVQQATADIDLSNNYLDPYHINQVIYDTDGNILINFRDLDAIYKVNRSNGNIMWVWGGSAARRNDFTYLNDSQDGFYGFSHQHDPKRLANGNILLFDNGNLKMRPISRAVEYQIDETAHTAKKVWEYYHTDSLFADFMGNAQRLPNGNTLIGWGANSMNHFLVVNTEVTPGGTKAFESQQLVAQGIYQSLRFVYKMDAVGLNINSSGNYDFNDTKNKTGVSLNFSTITGIGYTSVEKHAYPPYNINTPGVSLCTILPYRWVINNKGINSFSGKISFDLDMLPIHKHYGDIKLFWRESENNGNFTLLSTTYNSSTNRLEANITKFGEFFLAFSDVYEPSLLLPRAYMVNLPVDSVLIKWDVTTDLDKYIIQVSSDPNFGTLILDTANVFSNQIVLPQLRYYHDYYWRVKSYNETCESRWSFVRTFKTIIAPPDLVYPLNSAVEIDLKGTLRWMEVNGGYKYKLQVSGTPDFTVPLIDTIVTNITFFDYKDFQYGSKYYWRVAANSYGNYENWSKVWEFSTYFGKVSLSSPLEKQILIDRAGKLKWNHLANAIAYRVQVSRDSLFGENILDTLTGPVDESDYTGLYNSTTYYWHVLAYDSTTKSAWSDTWRFTTIFSAPQLRIPLNNSIKQSPDG